DAHLEEAFDGAADLLFVGVAAHPEHHLVAGFVHHGALLGDQRRGDDVEHAFHAVILPLSAATASRVSTRAWSRRRSSTLAPSARSTFTAGRLRAARSSMGLGPAMMINALVSPSVSIICTIDLVLPSGMSMPSRMTTRSSRTFMASAERKALRR